MAAFHLKDISAGFNKYTDNLRGLLFNHPEHLESFRRRKGRISSSKPFESIFYEY
jgi:hypothetical protein